MAIDNFCEGKNMEEYEVLKKAAAELNEIMHAAHINASDRAVYASGMLLAMHVLTPDSLYATEDTASHYIYRHLMDFLKDQLSPEMYQMTAREFQVLTSDPERDRYLDKLHGSYTHYIFCFIYQNIFQISDGMDSIGGTFRRVSEIYGTDGNGKRQGADSILYQPSHGKIDPCKRYRRSIGCLCRQWRNAGSCL